MRFIPLHLPGACLIEVAPRLDERGHFARAWCVREVAAAGLEPHVVQVNEAVSLRRGTLRGLHYQEPPHAEVKVVRCQRGAVWDVIVDLRPDSPTRWQWYGAELAERDGRMLYVPRGFAHGYQTLTDDAVLTYSTSEFYAPQAARGVRYDDPRLGISWPLPVAVISPQDRGWPLLAASEAVPLP